MLMQLTRAFRDYHLTSKNRVVLIRRVQPDSTAFPAINRVITKLCFSLALSRSLSARNYTCTNGLLLQVKEKDSVVVLQRVCLRVCRRSLK